MRRATSNRWGDAEAGPEPQDSGMALEDIEQWWDDLPEEEHAWLLKRPGGPYSEDRFGAVSQSPIAQGARVVDSHGKKQFYFAPDVRAFIVGKMGEEFSE